MDHLRKLRMFIRVADYRSFSAAADEAGLGQSTVSRAVAALEEEWGVALLHRSTRQISLTAAGKLAYEKALALIDASHGLDLAMTGGDPDHAGLLRIHASVAFAHFVLTPLISRFLAAHQRVELDFVVNDRALDLVADAIDIAFVAGRPKDSSLFTKKIGQFQRLIAASPELLRERGWPISPEQLAEMPCVVTTLAPNPSLWTLTSVERKVSVKVSGPLLANSGGVVREAMICGLGFGLVPAFLVLEDLRNGRLAPVLPEWRGTGFDVYAVWPSHHLLPTKARAFMSLVATELGRMSNALDPGASA